MAEHPILFSPPVMRTLLAGAKTQSRRLALDRSGKVRRPFAVGDTLWVREAVRFAAIGKAGRWVDIDYRADGLRRRIAIAPGTLDPGRPPGGWRNGLHMPRFASRVTLRLIAVRQHRLQAIARRDAEAEGMEPVARARWRVELPDETWHEADDPRAAFRLLWESLHGAGSWQTNPLVNAYEFKRL